MARHPIVLPVLALVLGAALPSRARADGEPDIRRNRVVMAVERARPAVVAIHTTQIVKEWRGLDLSEYFGPDELPRTKSLGSGVIFHPAGYVVTNAHVIARASEILVDVDRRDPTTGADDTVQLNARVLALDAPNDLAVLKLEPSDAARVHGPFAYMALGRSNDLMLGEDVVAVGNPYGLGFTVTTGVLSGIGRKFPGDQGDAKKGDVKDYLQIDAAINPGNSGGPLMDVTGRWIGVTSAILKRAMTGVEGIGFAIPADRIRSLLLKAMNRRLLTEEWIGIEEGEGKNGEATVQFVFPKGPAVAANLRPGDVIVTLNGAPVGSLYDYRMMMASLPLRTGISLSILREGRPLPEPVTRTLEPVPTATLSDRQFGLEAVSIDEDLNRTTTIPVDSGILIRRIRPGGPADRIKLRPNDLIVGLGGPQRIQRIHSADDLLIFLQYVQPGDLVKVKIRRGVRRLDDDRVLWEDKEGALVAE